MAASFAALGAGHRKFFSNSLDGPPVVEAARKSIVRMPRFQGKGRYHVEARTPAGVLNMAFDVVKWLGADLPTLIYHHGSNERPFSYGPLSKNSFRHIILSAEDLFETNLVVVMAPFHSCTNEYLDAIRWLVNFSSLLGASVRLSEELISALRRAGSGPVAMAGLSLGGWTVNLHRACYDTADVYLPVMAGAALGEVFLSSAYRSLTGRRALENPSVIRRVLNFEDEFAVVRSRNVFPLLARHDRIAVYEMQAACYAGHPLKVIQKGHVTGLMSPWLIRRHLIEHLHLPEIGG